MRGVLILAVLASSAAIAAAKCPAGEAKVVTVNSKNDEWTDVGMKLEPGDLLLIEASGEAFVGRWIGKVTADGASENIGRLMLKVGDGGGDPAGAHYFAHVKDGGELKLKVFDKKYEDNDGAFTVSVTRIPACAVPLPPK
jgi:hypothetical protein